MTDVSQSRENRGGDGNQVALLSLKLLLLAFFVLLNADSQFEEIKSQSVVESVRQAFSGRVESSENLTPQQAAIGPMDERRLVLHKVGDLFKSLLPVARRENAPHGTVVSFELPSGTIFRPGLAELQPGRAALLDGLVAVLGDDSELGIDYELVFLVNRPSVEEEAPLADSLAVRRLRAMSRQLVRRGLALERFSSGLFPADRDRVRFVLRLFDASPVAVR